MANRTKGLWWLVGVLLVPARGRLLDGTRVGFEPFDGTFRPAGVVQVGQAGATTYRYSVIGGKLRPTRIVAATPASSIDCTQTTLVRGCRALELVYGLTSAGLRLQRVELVAYDTEPPSDCLTMSLNRFARTAAGAVAVAALLVSCRQAPTEIRSDEVDTFLVDLTASAQQDPVEVTCEQFALAEELCLRHYDTAELVRPTAVPEIRCSRWDADAGGRWVVVEGRDTEGRPFESRLWLVREGDRVVAQFPLYWYGVWTDPAPVDGYSRVDDVNDGECDPQPHPRPSNFDRRGDPIS